MLDKLGSKAGLIGFPLGLLRLAKYITRTTIAIIAGTPSPTPSPTVNGTILVWRTAVDVAWFGNGLRVLLNFAVLVTKGGGDWDCADDSVVVMFHSSPWYVDSNGAKVWTMRLSRGRNAGRENILGLNPSNPLSNHFAGMSSEISYMLQSESKTPHANKNTGFGIRVRASNQSEIPSHLSRTWRKRCSIGSRQIEHRDVGQELNILNAVYGRISQNKSPL